MNPNYSDIIGRERPVHKNDDFDIRHPKMRRQLRAKQFAPFDALAGFQETVEEHQAVTVRPKLLSEGEREGINEALLQIQERFLAWKRERKRSVSENASVRVSVTFFRRDKRQEAIHTDGIRGDIVRLDGDVTAFDAVSQALWVSGDLVLFSDIYEIGIEKSCRSPDFGFPEVLSGSGFGGSRSGGSCSEASGGRTKFFK